MVLERVLTAAIRDSRLLLFNEIYKNVLFIDYYYTLQKLYSILLKLLSHLTFRMLVDPHGTIRK